MAKRKDVQDKKAREAVMLLASMCYHMIGDIGYRQIEEMVRITPPKPKRRGRG